VQRFSHAPPAVSPALDHTIKALVEMIDAGLHVAHRAHNLVLHLAHAVARDIGFRPADLVLGKLIVQQHILIVSREPSLRT
jgi:hypothetical protein